MKQILSCFLLVLIYQCGYTQEQITKNIILDWEETSYSNIHKDVVDIKIQTFANAAIDGRLPEISSFLYHLDIPSNKDVEVNILPIKTSPIIINNEEARNKIASNYQINTFISNSRGNYRANVSILPLRISDTGIEKLDEFTLEIVFKNKQATPQFSKRNVTTSQLAEGTIYKIKLNETGIYKIDASFLEDNFDISLGMNSSNIQLFGNKGGRLPRTISISRADDLIEMPLKMDDGGDGKFDAGDSFTFYGEGADRWSYDMDKDLYSHDNNPYDNSNFAFIKIDGNSGKRIEVKNSEGPAEYVSLDFDFLQIYEDDRTNLLGTFQSTEGTGKEWYGEYFGVETSQDFSSKFDINDVTNLGQGRAIMKMAIRGKNNTNTNFKVGNNQFTDLVSGTNLNDIEADYAKVAYIDEQVSLADGDNISIEFIKNATQDEAWLDYIQLEYRREIPEIFNQTRISDRQALNYDKASFMLPSSFEVWDVTDYNATSIITPTNSTFTYDIGQELPTFYLVKNSSYLSPEPLDIVENQNYHGVETSDFVIVTPSEFLDAANKLAEHRRAHNNYEVTVIDARKLYNEFSSGRQDPSALRDFAKMLADRDPGFKYMLLLGDGSYDYRSISPDLANHNFILAYETDESLDPIDGFPSDDFYALLSDEEGATLKGGLDIAIGRIPVSDSETANNIVNKIINYDINPERLGPWRTRIGFAADDEDTNLHLTQTDQIAENSETQHPIYNQTKIYFDSYIQESTPGGDRFPAASEAINNFMNKGALFLNYLGHGGPKGWAQERVLKISDIDSWENSTELPLLITATCSFTGYDDPSVITAGEYAMQKRNGGVVGLFTTTRAVFASQNERLAQAVFRNIFEKENGNALTFGEIITNAKNQNADPNNFLNDRKFSFIGDPSQRIALPQYNVSTLTINGIGVNEAEQDTLNALEQVTITGQITDENNVKVSNFNGKISISVFDKESTLQTLGNDNETLKRNFGMYRNVLFKGSATVSNGDFSITFVIPQDINYEVGTGRISYYADDGVSIDAAGYFNNVLIGGSDPNAVVDDEGPQAELFLNDESFVFGGTTNPDPIFIAKLSDDLGINVSGTSIGHDIEIVIDGDTQNSIILNDFYEANENDHTSGVVRYPLQDLEPGFHEIVLKAWDVSNNSTEARLEFTIEENEDGLLSNVYNYPNPFSTSTTFLFEHDLVGNDLDVYVDIYTVSGKLVKTIYQNVFASGPRISDVMWNGMDDYGTRIGKGIYFYKIKVKAKQLNTVRESKFEKLVKF